jgi:hypothetical protein
VVGFWFVAESQLIKDPRRIDKGLALVRLRGRSAADKDRSPLLRLVLSRRISCVEFTYSRRALRGTQSAGELDNSTCPV